MVKATFERKQTIKVYILHYLCHRYLLYGHKLANIVPTGC